MSATLWGLCHFHVGFLSTQTPQGIKHLMLQLLKDENKSNAYAQSNVY